MPIEHVSQMVTVNGSEPAIDQYDRISKMAFTLPVASKAANYTCLKEDSGTVFLATTGAVTFTLPDCVANPGWCAWFINGVNANMVVSRAGSDTMVYDNSTAVTTLTWSTSSHKIGGAVFVVSNGTTWDVFVAGNGLAAPTAA